MIQREGEIWQGEINRTAPLISSCHVTGTSVLECVVDACKKLYNNRQFSLTLCCHNTSSGLMTFGFPLECYVKSEDAYICPFSLGYLPPLRLGLHSSGPLGSTSLIASVKLEMLACTEISMLSLWSFYRECSSRV